MYPLARFMKYAKINDLELKLSEERTEHLYNVSNRMELRSEVTMRYWGMVGQIRDGNPEKSPEIIREESYKHLLMYYLRESGG